MVDGYDAPGKGGPGSYIFQRGRWWKAAPLAPRTSPVQMATMADVAALQAALDALVAVAPEIPAAVVQALQERTAAAEAQAAVVAEQVSALQQVAAVVAPAVAESAADQARLRDQVASNTSQVGVNTQAVARISADLQAARADVDALRQTVTASIDALRAALTGLTSRVDAIPAGLTSPGKPAK